MNAEKLVETLRQIDCMDSAEIAHVIEAVKTRQDQLRREAAQAFKVGDKVWFNAKRRGTQRGIVEAFNAKSVVVRVARQDSCSGREMIWRVAPTLLNRDAR